MMLDGLMVICKLSYAHTYTHRDEKQRKFVKLMTTAAVAYKFFYLSMFVICVHHRMEK